MPGRDDLAFRLWRRGEHEAAAVELEESFYRFLSSISHTFLGPDVELTPADDALRRARARRRRHAGHLATPRSRADRGHRAGPRPRARRGAGGRRARTSIVADRVTLLEAARPLGGGRGHAARRGAASMRRDDQSLGHAARDYLKANDPERAEEALLAALLRNPERGRLYQRLAVDIYTRARRVSPWPRRCSRRASATPSTCCPVYDGVGRRHREARAGVDRAPGEPGRAGGEPVMPAPRASRGAARRPREVVVRGLDAQPARAARHRAAPPQALRGVPAHGARAEPPARQARDARPAALPGLPVPALLAVACGLRQRRQHRRCGARAGRRLGRVAARARRAGRGRAPTRHLGGGRARGAVDSGSAIACASSRGPLAGLEGLVRDRCRGRATFVVNVDLLQRSVGVEVEAALLERC